MIRRLFRSTALTRNMDADIPIDHPLRNPGYVAGLAHGTALRLEAMEKRVEALEARLPCASTWIEQDGKERFIPTPPAPTPDLTPVATDEELDLVFMRAPIGNEERALYNLGREHGAAAAQPVPPAPVPDYSGVAAPPAPPAGGLANTGLLPMIVFETGSDSELEIERIICSAMSGGADYVNDMPRELSLERILNGTSIHARYVQASLEMAMEIAQSAIREVADRIEETGRQGWADVACWLRQVIADQQEASR